MANQVQHQQGQFRPTGSRGPELLADHIAAEMDTDSTPARTALAGVSSDSHLAVVDAGLKLMPRDDSRSGDIGPVDLNDAAEHIHAVPPGEHNPKSATRPLKPESHCSNSNSLLSGQRPRAASSGGTQSGHLNQELTG